MVNKTAACSQRRRQKISSEGGNGKKTEKLHYLASIYYTCTMHKNPGGLRPPCPLLPKPMHAALHKSQSTFCFMLIHVQLQLPAARAQKKLSYSLFNKLA